MAWYRRLTTALLLLSSVHRGDGFQCALPQKQRTCRFRLFNSYLDSLGPRRNGSDVNNGNSSNSDDPNPTTGRANGLAKETSPLPPANSGRSWDAQPQYVFAPPTTNEVDTSMQAYLAAIGQLTPAANTDRNSSSNNNNIQPPVASPSPSTVRVVKEIESIGDPGAPILSSMPSYGYPRGLGTSAPLSNQTPAKNDQSDVVPKPTMPFPTTRSTTTGSSAPPVPSFNQKKDPASRLTDASLDVEDGGWRNGTTEMGTTSRVTANSAPRLSKDAMQQETRENLKGVGNSKELPVKTDDATDMGRGQQLSFSDFVDQLKTKYQAKLDLIAMGKSGKQIPSESASRTRITDSVVSVSAPEITAAVKSDKSNEVTNNNNSVDRDNNTNNNDIRISRTTSELVSLDTKGMTERIMKRIPKENQASGAGGASSWEAFQRTEANWEQLRLSKSFQYDVKAMGNVDARGNPPPPSFVTQDVASGNPQCWAKLIQQNGKQLDYDVAVCGGTLGIFFAAALQLKGHKVCVVEAGQLRGREQEWNLSMNEIMELVKIGVLTTEDVSLAIKTDFPGCRSGFKNSEVSPLKGGYFDNRIGFECFTEDVLNLGVAPNVLIECAARNFKENGGVVIDQTRLGGICISDAIGAALDVGNDAEPITARLVVDCMGNASPISRQQRHGLKPDGVCAVVGSCASGYDPKTNLIGDLIYTNQKIVDKGANGKLQYFWEAFPVGIGKSGLEPGASGTKTTYMFTYMDAHQHRPSLQSLMDDYWRLLPVYQPSIKNPETDLDVKRVLFAYFPTYRDSPLKPHWNRILAVGDASGIQSPLSFGGFGALTRHLDRISGALSEALEENLLLKEDLGEINAYLPNLSATWMFQKPCL